MKEHTDWVPINSLVDGKQVTSYVLQDVNSKGELAWFEMVIGGREFWKHGVHTAKWPDGFETLEEAISVIQQQLDLDNAREKRLESYGL